jgi:SecD/SecF fusion protein
MKKQLLKAGLVMLTIFAVLSCSRKVDTLKLQLEVRSANGLSNERIKACILEQLLSFDDQLELKDISLTGDGNALNLTVENFAEDNEANEAVKQIQYRLTRPNTGLKIYETYDMAECYPYLMKLDDLLKEANTDTVPVKAAKTPETLEEKLAAKTDSMNREEAKNRHFRGLLTLNFEKIGQVRFNMPPGPVFGYCLPKDTAELFAVFRQGYAAGIFPKNLLIRTSTHEDKIGMLDLYALRLTPPFNKPAMEGDMIASATEGLDPNTGQAFISLQFEHSYVNEWKELTKRSAPSFSGQGKSLAMVVDNKVLSAPVVYGEIPNGATQISGIFTMEEINDICNRLKAPYMPCELVVVGIDLIPQK